MKKILILSVTNTESGAINTYPMYIEYIENANLSEAIEQIRQKYIDEYINDNLAFLTEKEQAEHKERLLKCNLEDTVWHIEGDDVLSLYELTILDPETLSTKIITGHYK